MQRIQRSLRGGLAAMMLATGLGLGLAGVASARAEDGSFTLPAWAFDRGNVKTFTAEYADAGPMVAFGGRSPVLVEYDLDFPSAGDYRVSLCYAAAQPRPVNFLLDGKILGQVCRGATGSWNTSGAKPEAPFACYIPKGKHTVRLQRVEDFPHIVSLRFE